MTGLGAGRQGKGQEVASGVKKQFHGGQNQDLARLLARRIMTRQGTLEVLPPNKTASPARMIPLMRSANRAVSSIESDGPHSVTGGILAPSERGQEWPQYPPALLAASPHGGAGVPGELAVSFRDGVHTDGHALGGPVCAGGQIHQADGRAGDASVVRTRGESHGAAANEEDVLSGFHGLG